MMLDLALEEVQETDSLALADLFIRAFADKTWGPHGPGGDYIFSLWPGMDTERGRVNARQRFAALVAASRAEKPGNQIKAVDRSSGELAGYMLLQEHDRPTKERLSSTIPDPAHFASDAAYRRLMRLREDRNDVCWRAAGTLPDEPFINLKLLAVDPAYQRRGVGSALIAHATALADGGGTHAGGGAVNMFVHATPIRAAIAAYERHGFVVAADQCIPAGGGDDEVKTRIVVLLRRKKKTTTTTTT